jgi:hypothetical protein
MGCLCDKFWHACPWPLAEPDRNAASFGETLRLAFCRNQSRGDYDPSARGSKPKAGRLAEFLQKLRIPRQTLRCGGRTRSIPPACPRSILPFAVSFRRFCGVARDEALLAAEVPLSAPKKASPHAAAAVAEFESPNLTNPGAPTFFAEPPCRTAATCNRRRSLSAPKSRNILVRLLARETSRPM